MKRREFITLIGGAAAWPLAARAQQVERMRRIGWLTASLALNDPEIQARNAKFVERLRELGWVEGNNVQIDFRSGAGNIDVARKHAAELVTVADVVLANASQAVRVLQQTSRTVPIVFVQVPDPVGAGFVDSLAQPGSNATGFTSFEYAIGAKWLALLKEIAPAVKRVAVFRDPNDPAGSGQWGAIQSAAQSLGVELRPLDSRAEAGEIERTIANFARQPDGGLIVTASAGTAARRDRLITLFARHRLPTIFPNDYYVASGGLISYGTDIVDQYRQAAGYVDRILKGAKPADLPVQTPTRFKLTVNLKTVKALGLEVPPMLLARADEVIE
jgi:putative ABC transport system substrate-binding protein